MIYSITAKQADYEQIKQVVVSAISEKQALRIAKREFELAKNWVFPWEEQELVVEPIDTDKEDIIATVMV
ncbi:hypothetical protein [Leuconostoc mesenteroides]|uniref:hypothetical protein n=1 Tax=Leuconostoc mesenteroides TaxID=1245 RepID=UPI0007513562|nr:hypothetical protein [Leuconostoc mesenteroides]